RDWSSDVCSSDLDAFRLGARLTGRRAVAVYLGTCLLLGVVLSLSGMLTAELLLRVGTDDDPYAPFALAAKSAQGIAVSLALGGGIAALVLRARRWVRRA